MAGCREQPAFLLLHDSAQSERPSREHDAVCRVRGDTAKRQDSAAESGEMDLVVEIEDGVGCLGQSDSETRLEGVAEGGNGRLRRRQGAGYERAAAHSVDLSGQR